MFALRVSFSETRTRLAPLALNVGVFPRKPSTNGPAESTSRSALAVHTLNAVRLETV